MKRKILQHFADMLCQIFVGWRIGDDMVKIITFPEKIVLTVDVLKGKSDAPSDSNLYIVQELQAWFISNSRKHNVEIAKIEKVILIAEIVRCPKKKRFKINCSSLIQTDEKEYKSELRNHESWAFI